MTPELEDRLESIEFRASDSVKAVVAALLEAVKALEEVRDYSMPSRKADRIITTALATIETLLKK